MKYHQWRLEKIQDEVWVDFRPRTLIDTGEGTLVTDSYRIPRTVEISVDGTGVTEGKGRTIK